MAKLHWEAGRKALVSRERGTIRVKPEVVDWARHPDAAAEREMLNRIAHQKVDYGLVQAPLTIEEEERARRAAAHTWRAERAGEALHASLRIFRVLVAEFQDLAPQQRVSKYPEVQAKAQELQRAATRDGVVEGVEGWGEFLVLQLRLQQAYEEGLAAQQAKRHRMRR